MSNPDEAWASSAASESMVRDARKVRETDMVELEIIARRPERGRRGPRLLFVHGICVGAWIWDEHFLPFFAEAGFEAHAVSLRGHGGSGGRDRLSSWRLADYTDDLREAA